MTLVFKSNRFDRRVLKRDGLFYISVNFLSKFLIYKYTYAIITN